MKIQLFSCHATMFKVTVQVHPHIEKFIRAYCKQDPIPVTTGNVIGFTLFSLLDKDMNYHSKAYKLPERSLEFMIDEFNYKRSGSELAPVKVRIFNELIHDIFKDKLFTTIDTVLLSYPEYRHRKPVTEELQHSRYSKIYRRYVDKQVKKPEIKDVILNFMKYHDITEEDFSFEAAKKAYYRYRTEYGQRSKIFG